MDRSKPKLEKTACERNKRHGVEIGGRAVASIEVCQCNENLSNGVSVDMCAFALVANSSCSRNSGAGLSRDGGPSYYGCILAENKYGPVLLY